MITRIIFTLCLVLSATPVFGQEPAAPPQGRRPIDAYLSSIDAKETIAKTPREFADLRQVMPLARPNDFAQYVRARFPAGLREDLEHLKLDELVGNSATGSGTTALLSRVAGPGLIGFAVEAGAITQSGSGTAWTLRANALGLTRLAIGANPFPYCPVIDPASCNPASRWLRRFSGSATFERKAPVTGSTPAEPSAPDLVGDDFRVSTWTARFNFGHTDPDDPHFAKGWQEAIDTLRDSPSVAALSLAVNDLFADASGVPNPIYLTWQQETAAVLKSAAAGEFATLMEKQLDLLIDKMIDANPAFLQIVSAVDRAHGRYFEVRDDLLQEIQSHQAGVEFTAKQPVNQPHLSAFRFMYSHQPSKKYPVLITFNLAATMYTESQAETDTGRWRDVQAAAQFDRRMPSLAESVLTAGVYFQWMLDDGLITVETGNAAPGSGITIPKSVEKIFGTKGTIVVAQLKYTLPVAGLVKIPVSVTWANRHELVATEENEIQGQVGFTLDLDSVFKKRVR